jgi:hypothetical protein
LSFQIFLNVWSPLGEPFIDNYIDFILSRHSQIITVGKQKLELWFREPDYSGFSAYILDKNEQAGSSDNIRWVYDMMLAPDRELCCQVDSLSPDKSDISDSLESQLRETLEKVSDIPDLKVIVIIPPSSAVTKAMPDDKQHEITHKIAEIYVRTLVEFILKNDNKPLPQFTLCVFDPQSWYTFDVLVRHWAHSGQRILHEEKVDDVTEKLVKKIHTHSQAYIEVVRRAADLFLYRMTFVLTGETGVGKEFLARALNEAGGYDKDIVAVNASSIPNTLLQAELFGYEEGAFTGAVGTKEGLVEAAEGRVLFLDEISDPQGCIQCCQTLGILGRQSFHSTKQTESRRRKTIHD